MIEKLTGQSYEAYVVQEVLKPLGITEMQLGATRLDGRKAKEVRYYDPRLGASVFADTLGTLVPQPYGAWNLEAMDSHGGWLASASDLVRFASAFDFPETSSLLSAQSIREMFDRPDGQAGYDANGTPKMTYYGLGWSVAIDAKGQVTASHSGSLPGTNTFLSRRPDGRNVALLFNTRVKPQKHPAWSTLSGLSSPKLSIKLNSGHNGIF